MLETLTVVVPAFNERDSLERHLPRWLAWCASHEALLIVVDDGSSDGVEELLAAHLTDRRLRVFRHRGNRGYGDAIKTGIYRTETPYVATMDADGQHAIEDIELLKEAMLREGADLVVGARPANQPGGGYRRLGKAVIRRLASLLFSMKIRDLNSGMKIYRTELVKQLLPFCPGSMAFSDVVTLAHLNLRCVVGEVPIQVVPREAGKSTINTMTAVDTVLEIINVMMWFRPLKIFLPLSGLLMVLGTAWAVPFLAAGRGLSSIALLLILTGLMCAMLGLIAEQMAAGRRIDLPEVATTELKSSG